MHNSQEAMKARGTLLYILSVCVQRRDAVVTSDTLSLSVLVPPGSSIIWFVGLVQVLFDASKSRHKLLSESARPDAGVRSEHADTYL